MNVPNIIDFFFYECNHFSFKNNKFPKLYVYLCRRKFNLKLPDCINLLESILLQVQFVVSDFHLRRWFGH